MVLIYNTIRSSGKGREVVFVVITQAKTESLNSRNHRVSCINTPLLILPTTLSSRYFTIIILLPPTYSSMSFRIKGLYLLLKCPPKLHHLIYAPNRQPYMVLSLYMIPSSILLLPPRLTY